MLKKYCTKDWKIDHDTGRSWHRQVMTQAGQDTGRSRHFISTGNNSSEFSTVHIVCVLIKYVY